MNNKIKLTNERIMLFLFGCIGLRLLIGIYIRDKINPNIKKILTMILIIIGLGFLTIYIGNFRKRGLEVDNQEIWWNYLRPLHGILYLFAGFFLYKNKNIASSNIIILDLIIGLVSWYFYYYIN
tara:strand:+ start:8077 stop:8448 length:372 start_codon:yes stop_codon:yes gene_type:complete